MGCTGSALERGHLDRSVSDPDLSVHRRVSRLPSLRNFFTNAPDVTFEDKYTKSDKILGKGGSGEVFEGTFRDSESKVAIKVINKKGKCPIVFSHKSKNNSCC